MSNYSSPRPSNSKMNYSKRSSLSQKLATVMQENAEKDAFIARLEGDLLDLRNYLGKLKDKEHEVINDLEKEIKELKQQLKSEKQRKTRNKLSNVPTKDVSDLFQSTLDDIKYIELQDNLDEIDFDVMLNKQKEIKELASKVSQLQQELTDDEEKFEILNQENEKLKKVIASRNSQLATMRTQISELKKNNDKHEEDANKARKSKQKIDQLERRLSKKRSHVQKLKKLFDSVIAEKRMRDKNENARFKKVLSNRNRKLASMKKEMDSMRKSVDRSTNQTDDDNKLNAKSEEVDDLRNMLDEYKKMNALIDRKSQQQELEINALKHTIIELLEQLNAKNDEINQDQIWLQENANKLQRLTVIGDKYTKSKKSSNVIGFLWILSIIALFGGIVYNISTDYQYWKEKIQFDAQFGITESENFLNVKEVIFDNILRWFNAETNVEEKESTDNTFSSWNLFVETIGINNHDEEMKKEDIENKDVTTPEGYLEEIVAIIEEMVELEDEPSNEPVQKNETSQPFWTKFMNQDEQPHQSDDEDIKQQTAEEEVVEESSILDSLLIGAGSAFITYVVWRKVFPTPQATIADDENKTWRRDTAGRLSSKFTTFN